MRDPSDPDPRNELAELSERLRGGMGAGLGGDPWTPAVDIFETDDAVVVRLEMAGVRGADLRVNVDAEVLRIRGVRRTPDSSGIRRLHQMEIAFGPFETSVRLGVPFDREGVTAHLEDGLLEVRLPRRRAVRVPVETEPE